MSVLNMKPHLLQFSTFQQGTYDENGDYTGDTYTFEDPIPCNAIQSEGKAEVEVFEDGKNDGYSYTVYLPPMEREINVGDMVRITLDYGRVQERAIKGVKKYQLQCKLWV